MVSLITILSSLSLTRSIPGLSLRFSCVVRSSGFPWLTKPIVGYSGGLFDPDRCNRVQAEHAQAYLQQRLHRHAQRQ